MKWEQFDGPRGHGWRWAEGDRMVHVTAHPVRGPWVVSIRPGYQRRYATLYGARMAARDVMG